ncbi:MAG TPA: alpha/beta hydrolase [Solirubrobacteraceae bacterium]
MSFDDEHLTRAMREGMRVGMAPSAPLHSSLRDGVLELWSPGGVILGLLAGPPDAQHGALMVGGAIGGFGGPAGSVYHDLADRLAAAGIASLRLHGRAPSDLEACVQDVLVAMAWWSERGLRRAVAVGHSLGGATALTAAALIPELVGVVALASQTAGTELVDRLGETPVLVIHGDADPVIPLACSVSIHQRVPGRKELVVLPGCGHVMSEAADEIVERLATWIPATLG